MKKLKLLSFLANYLTTFLIFVSSSFSFCQEPEPTLNKDFNVGKEVEINQMGKKWVEKSDFDKHLKISEKEVLLIENEKIIQRYKVKKKETISGNIMLTTVLDERSIFKVWIYKCNCIVRIENPSWEFKYKVKD